MMNTNNEIPAYGVNERATQRSQLSPGNGTVVVQTGRGVIILLLKQPQEEGVLKKITELYWCYY